MQDERFEEFVALITGVYRDVQKLKAARADELGLKQVHIFWVYLLMHHPEGLTASEIARLSRIDRSLVSREIDALSAQGYLQSDQASGQRRYAAKLNLTDKGRSVARRISELALDVQNGVDAGITPEELDGFYRTLRKLRSNFDALVSGKGNMQCR